ncbi:hypothetical protein DDW11_02405 [Sulfolobus sp. SCGC AB-777_G06]|nr:hypothetical protein DDW11_02405 [Sulfolobus sp. SCGC AB-777_G06]
MRRIFKVNITGLIIITLFIFSTFPSAATVAALFIAAAEPSPITFVLTSYVLPFEFAGLGYNCYGG